MKQHVTRREALKFVGKNIVAVKKDGTRVTGKLLKVSGNKLVLKRVNGKKARTKAILPLVLFDLLAIATLPYAYGPGPGYGGPGYGGPGYGPGYGPGPKPGPGYGPGPGFGPYGPRPPGFF
ncbi:hypothetical protein [Paenibacillus illinoisensis]|uniref:hypothetical protein n=1 Tax=Paenibacillus illinoisensis TaxID=59845 RepID=UPI003D2B5886